MSRTFRRFPWLGLVVLPLLAWLVPAGPVRAQKEPDSRKALYHYLVAEAKKHFQDRRAVVAKTKTAEEINERQKDLKVKFIASLGGFPEKTPLNAQVVGSVKGDGFTVEKVIFESRPNHHVTGNLYIPEGKGPFPGILVPCGHSANGKASEAYQRASILLARNGMMALCYDPIGQGERLQLLDKNGKTLIAGSTGEHTMVGIGALLVGRQTASYRIWDGIRSLDYLASRPEVDTKRLGCTGNSGGGTLTSYLMALDDRIAVAAPSCYICSLEKLFDTLGPQDAEQNITGQVAFGMEHADFITMRAPKPTLILVGTYDFFSIDGAWNVFREASLIYSRLGHGERVGLFEYEDKHGFSQPRREAAARWMARWLLNRDEPITEGKWPHFKDEDLRCTRTGQVLEDWKGKSVHNLNVEASRDLAKNRTQQPLDEKSLAPRVRSLLAVRELNTEKGPSLKDRFLKQSAKDGGIVFQSLSFDVEPGLRLPGTLYGRGGQPGKNLVIFLSEEPREKTLAPISQLVQENNHVLAVDLRGLGALSPSEKLLLPFGNDQKEAFLGLHLNRPLLGQRVNDLLAVVKRCQGYDSLRVVGVGRLGPIALHAAFLDSRIQQLDLEKSLISWTNVVESPVSQQQLANVVPGALQYYDLPDLVGLLAGRAVTIRTPVDAQGRPVSTEDAENAYRLARDHHQKAGSKLVLETSKN